MQETQVPFLGWEEPLEKGQATHSSVLGLPLWLSWYVGAIQATHSSTLAWRIPGSQSQT